VLSRFASNIALVVLSAVLITLSLTSPATVVGWLALGVGCAAVVITLLAFAARRRGTLQRMLDVAAVAIGGWTIVASRTYTGHTLRWLSFSEADAICSLALVGLIAHELLTERGLRRATELSLADGRVRLPLDESLPERARTGAW
jgi:hypothetical protein